MHGSAWLQDVAGGMQTLTGWCVLAMSQCRNVACLQTKCRTSVSKTACAHGANTLDPDIVNSQTNVAPVCIRLDNVHYPKMDRYRLKENSLVHLFLQPDRNEV